MCHTTVLIGQKLGCMNFSFVTFSYHSKILVAGKSILSGMKKIKKKGSAENERLIKVNIYGGTDQYVTNELSATTDR